MVMELEIPKEVYLFCAGQILEEIRKTDDIKMIYAMVKGWTYKIMTNSKMSDDELYKHIKQLEALLEQKVKLIETQIKSSGGDVFDSGGFVNIHSGVKTAKPREQLLGHKITFKEYFTLVPLNKGPEKAIGEYGTFIERLVELFRYTRGLSIKYYDDVSFKFPAIPENLISHPDTLVVYYKTKGLGAIIREIVRDVMGPAGIVMGRRKDRVKSGFDVHSIETGEAFSHSELVSRVVARYFIRTMLHRKYQINAEELSRWLESQIIAVNEWPINAIIGTINRDKI